jgi:glycosyltransferase involved in cell wall biosynthesis
MRLLMISDADAPWTPHFARFFTARRDDLLIVSFAPGLLDGAEGVPLEFVGTETRPRREVTHLFLTRVPRIRRIVRRFSPDLVFAPYLASNGLAAALSWWGPTVVAAVGGDVLNQVRGRSGWKLLLREAILRFVCRRAALVNAVSQPLEDELIRLGVPASKILQLPFGVDLRRFHPDDEMPRASAAKLICTRKHEEIYDIPTIIDALARLKATGRRFHCTFTSEGTRLSANRECARAAGLEEHTSFTGTVPHSQLPSMLRASDIYITAARSDGTSVSLLEAMASGLLPVVPRIPANEPWIEHGKSGLMFDAGEAGSLADALVTALDDDQLRQRVFEKNRRRVERDGDMDQNMSRLAETFTQLIASSRKA